MNESVKVALAPKTTKKKKSVGRPKNKMKASGRPKKKMKTSGRPKKLCSWSDEQMRPKNKMKASGRPKKLCSWSDEQMRWAMEAVMNGELGINHSAIQYGVPKTTPRYHFGKGIYFPKLEQR